MFELKQASLYMQFIAAYIFPFIYSTAETFIGMLSVALCVYYFVDLL